LLKKLIRLDNPETSASHRLLIELEGIIAETEEGGQLLTEPLLAKQLGVSRSTLREAMRSFEMRGLIRRRQGQGTFVVGKYQTLEAGLEKLESIETIAKRIDLPVSMGQLTTQLIAADATLAGIMKIEPGGLLLRIKRIMLAENRPVAFLVDNLLENAMKEEDLKRPEFRGSVMDLLLSRKEAGLSHAQTDIQAMAASAEIARALQIQRGDALLNFTSDLYSHEGQIVDHSESYFLPGYFRFHINRRI